MWCRGVCDRFRPPCFGAAGPGWHEETRMPIAVIGISNAQIKPSVLASALSSSRNCG